MKTKTPKNSWKTLVVISGVIGGALSLFASSAPDGLERVAASQGFLGKGVTLLSAPLAEYTVPGIHSTPLATALGGIFGVGIVFGVLLFAGKVLYGSRLIRQK
ncbi:MAG: PDGLE domain-containing protein [Candidatus Moraniibacteriota bacterium]|nr:MAG: PDGLE domain-containing protein [Candidatus Moranbacteria bacterium]